MNIPGFRIGWMLVLVVALLAWVVHVFVMPSEIVVQYVADDAYYYLGLARGHSQTGLWSIDGVSPTNGFHPLHAYALSCLYTGLHPGVDEFVIIGATYGVLVLLMTLLAVSLQNKITTVGLALISAFLLSRNTLINVSSGMEWPLMVALSILFFWGAQVSITSSRIRDGLLTGFVAFFCVLIRSDYSLVLGAISLALLVIGLRRNDAWFLKLGASWITFGLLAVLTTAFLNYEAAADITTSSVRTKLFWTSLAGPSPMPYLRLIFKGILGGSLSVLIVLACLLWVVYERFEILRAPTGPIWLGSVLSLALLGLAYSNNSVALQPWYSSTVIIPLMAGIYFPIAGMHRYNQILVLTFLLLLQLHTLVQSGFLPEWRHQESSYRAATWLRDHKAALQGRVGAWNAGVLAYYSDGGVTNLDGLVNNSAIPFITHNDLATYVDQSEIHYILDFVNMLESEDARRRGGFGAAFVQRLTPISVFDDSQLGLHRLTLYRIESPPDK